MIRFAACLCIALAGQPAAAQRVHPCASDALARAERLLLLHQDDPGGPAIDLEGRVEVIAPLRALRGSGYLDVLETWGYIYRASYRMRFIYVQSPDYCALVGQEIIEHVDPY
jgi:hypothetical protein